MLSGIGAGVLLLAGCQTDQSVLHPASQDSAEVARLFWVMAFGGAVIWCLVIGAAIYAVVGRRKPKSEQFADRFILAGGVVFPTLALAGLLFYGLRMLPEWRTSDDPDLRVHIVGEQYWWRIRYELADGRLVETANELHLPEGHVVEFVLTAQDVIHSFWIPALGGKLDVIPGRTNILRLTPEKTGQFRGACAEYCGLSHALMALQVTVHDPDDFQLWLAGQAAPAAGDATAFASAGCGACHHVRGLVEQGAVGPDLTHLMARRTLGAGTVDMTRANLAQWLDDPAAFKPDVRMPSYAHLPTSEKQAILDFLMELP
jgi:cytochrome c oxidase subunit 2